MTTLNIPPITPEIASRFEKFVHYEPNSGCWLWGGCASPLGYGEFGIGRKHFRASRVAWAIANGQLSSKLFMCHKCDNPSCVNPDHLFIGTQSDNMKDCVRKNRNAKKRTTIPTNCRNGHLLTSDSLGTDEEGFRKCMECYRQRIRRNSESRRLRAALSALGDRGRG